LLLPVVSLDRYIDFLIKLREVSQYASAHVINESISAFGLRLFVPVDRWYTFPNMYVIPAWLKVLNLAALGTAAGISAYLAWQKTKPAEMPLILGALLLSLSAVCSPLGWGHTYIYTLPLIGVTWKIWQPKLQGHVTGQVAVIVIGIVLLIPVYSNFEFLRALPDLVKNLYYSRLLFITVGCVILTWVGMSQRCPTMPGGNDPA